MGIEVAKARLSDILSNRKKYRIASYQRKYEWPPSAITALTEDLLQSFERGKSSAPDAYHFIGSLIIHEKNRELQIIDGQQRLTSISIIIACLRDMVSVDGRLRETLHGYVVDPGPRSDSRPEKRILHHRGDEANYDLLVVPPGCTSRPPQIDEENIQGRKMATNVAAARKALAGLKTDDDIAAFQTHAMEYCQVISIRIDGADDAFRIFSTINGRGQPLRDADVLRVTLIEDAVADLAKRKRFLKIWDDAEGALGAESFDRYLRLKRFAMIGEISDDPNSSIRQAPSSDFCTDAESFFAEELARECEGLKAAIGREIEWAHDKRRYPYESILYSLSRVQSDEWQALFLVIYRKFITSGRPTEQQRLELLMWMRKLERLAWRFEFDAGERHVVANRRIRFANILKYMRNHSTWVVANSDIELTEAEKRGMCDALTSPIDPAWPALRNVLIRIEQAIRGGEPPWAIRDDHTIEHVIPKNGGDAAWQRELNLPLPAVKELARRLGNLCFVTKSANKEMDERPFAEKRAIAKAARASRSSILARDLCNAEKWNEDLVNKRTKRFVGVLSGALDLN